MFMPKLKRWFASQDPDPLVEGWYADQYTSTAVRDRITSEYQARHQPPQTPLTHPQLFDPLNPPTGWRYDPYYEIWITHD